MSQFNNMSPAAIAAWNKLIQHYPDLAISSAYRDPNTNKRVGGAGKSQHMHGNAFDVPVPGMSHEDQLALIRKAYDSGFRGVGVYGNSLHFDVGPARHWGPDYSGKTTPNWARGVLAELIGGAPPSTNPSAPPVTPNGNALTFGLPAVDPNAPPSFGPTKEQQFFALGKEMAAPPPAPPPMPEREPATAPPGLLEALSKPQPQREYQNALLALLMGAK